MYSITTILVCSITTIPVYSITTIPTILSVHHITRNIKYSHYKYEAFALYIEIDQGRSIHIQYKKDDLFISNMDRR